VRSNGGTAGEGLCSRCSQPGHPTQPARAAAWLVQAACAATDILRLRQSVAHSPQRLTPGHTAPAPAAPPQHPPPPVAAPPACRNVGFLALRRCADSTRQPPSRDASVTQSSRSRCCSTTGIAVNCSSSTVHSVDIRLEPGAHTRAAATSCCSRSANAALSLARASASASRCAPPVAASSASCSCARASASCCAASVALPCGVVRACEQLGQTCITGSFVNANG
jgi:hypothetical protein